MQKLENKFLFFIAVFFVMSSVYAQQKELQGHITNKTDVEGIHILNQSSRRNVVTNKTTRIHK